ncbi:hypothetical protein C8T65DRAFT_294181 [Cerioporus squamosus]|nr:hypothetical protein C8T65DRAFT_294181 [Cerioporus squamosus]
MCPVVERGWGDVQCPPTILARLASHAFSLGRWQDLERSLVSRPTGRVLVSLCAFGVRHPSSSCSSGDSSATRSRPQLVHPVACRYCGHLSSSQQYSCGVPPGESTPQLWTEGAGTGAGGNRMPECCSCSAAVALQLSPFVSGQATISSSPATHPPPSLSYISDAFIGHYTPHPLRSVAALPPSPEHPVRVPNINLELKREPGPVAHGGIPVRTHLSVPSLLRLGCQNEKEATHACATRRRAASPPHRTRFGTPRAVLFAVIRERILVPACPLRETSRRRPTHTYSCQCMPLPTSGPRATPAYSYVLRPGSFRGRLWLHGIS